MKVKITIVRMGGGYVKAIVGQGPEGPESVFGSDEEELLERLRIKLPGIRQQIRRGTHELVDASKQR